MTRTNPKSEVLPGRERRRRWALAEKLAMVSETYERGMTGNLVARRHGVAPNQLFSWRRLARQGALTATQAEEAVVPASDYRAIQSQIRELAQRRRGLLRQVDQARAKARRLPFDHRPSSPIKRFLAETNVHPKLFTWTADPDEMIAAVRRGHQTLASYH